MQSKSVTGLLLALLTFGLIVSAALFSTTPQVAAAPRFVITPTSEPPTPTPTEVPPTATPTTPPTATPTEVPPTATPTTPPTTTPTEVPPTATPTEVPPTATPTSEPPPPPTATPTEVPEPPPAVADPAVAKSVDRPGVALGELLRFAITVTNQGTTAAIGVIVEDTLPSYLEYVSASVERGEVVTSGPTVGFWIGRVAPGEVIRGEIVARVVSLPPGGVGTNVVVLRSDSPTDRPENNRASTSFQVIQPAPEPSPDDPAPPVPGEPAPSDPPAVAPGAPTATPEPGQPTPSPTPEPLAVTPALPPAGGELPGLAPPASLPTTAGYGALPYGLIFLVGVGYMGLGLYFWLGPRRRRK